MGGRKSQLVRGIIAITGRRGARGIPPSANPTHVFPNTPEWGGISDGGKKRGGGSRAELRTQYTPAEPARKRRARGASRKPPASSVSKSDTQTQSAKPIAPARSGSTGHPP